MTHAKKINLWIHDDRFSKEDVIINPDKFPGISLGSLLEIIPASESFENGLVVQIQNINRDILTKHPQLQISISQNLAGLLGLSSRTDVFVNQISSESVVIDYVELHFKDQYIGRADMWGLKKYLMGKCIYSGEKLVTLGIRAQVKEINIKGNSTKSGFVSDATRIIFRSESAKCFIFIQMSSEMWDFDEDGDLFAEKCINGFFPDLFERWRKAGNNHVVSIVLFSRLFISDQSPDNSSSNNEPKPQLHHSGKYYRDYYNVFVDWEMRSDWSKILGSLRQRFLKFRKGILQKTLENGSTYLAGQLSKASEGNILEAVNLALNPFDKHFIDRDLMRTGLSIIVVTPGTGVFEVEKKLCRITEKRMIYNGLGLDLVCLSKPPLHTVPLFQFLSQEPITHRNFGNSISASDVFISPSYYSRSQEKLNSIVRQHRLMTTSQSVLSDRESTQYEAWDPLYYDDYSPNAKSERIYFNIPHWVDISFWRRQDGSSSIKETPTFLPRCKMYEVQMMGVMEQVGSSILVESLPSLSSGFKEEYFDHYDELVFSNNALRRDVETKKTLNTKSDIFNASPDKGAADTWRSSDFQKIGNKFLSTRFKSDVEIRRPAVSVITEKLKTSGLPENSDTSSTKSFKIEKQIETFGKDTAHPTLKLPNSFKKDFDLDGTHWRVGNPGFLKNSADSYKYASPIDFGSKIPAGSPSKHYSHSPRHRYGSFHQNYVNPCNPLKNLVKNNTQNRRWQYALPSLPHPSENTSFMNWRSLCTPACLPLITDYLPSADELATSYQEYMYTVGPSDEVSMGPQEAISRNIMESFLDELLRQRLAQGYQLISPSKNVDTIVDISHTSTSSTANCIFFMSLDDQIHKLSSDMISNNVEVRRYVRRINYSQAPVKYSCHIWPIGADFYETRSVTFVYPSLASYNWNYLDHILSGYQDEINDSLRLWKTRYLLIPAETGPNKAFVNPGNEVLDDEELRLAGFRKFVELFEKSRRISPEEKKQKSRLPSINIVLSTLDTTVFVRDEVNRSSRSAEGTPVMQRQSSLSYQEEFLNKNSDLNAIASAMQGANGVPFKDRRWHFKVYTKTFVGNECVDWLIRSFSDIGSRSEAEDFGNILLEKGVFQHVSDKHKFLDGHYFYRLISDFVINNNTKDRSNMGWLRNTILKAVTDPPEFKTTINTDLKPLIADVRSPTVRTSDSLSVTFRGQAIELSRLIQIDLDPSKKSLRDEIAFLHYDTVYNPSNCFHFQIHWLACTARLIEDLLKNWTRIAEKCGYKLVEAPIEQASGFKNDNPFHTIITIPLAVEPPVLDYFKSSESVNVDIPDIWYEMELVKELGFILDVESDARFPMDSVAYSFDKAEYKHTQYVHRSGIAFLQILPNHKGFQWSTNKLYLSSIAKNVGVRSQSNIDPEQIRQTVEALCSDHEQLQVMYDKFTERLSGLLTKTLYPNPSDSSDDLPLFNTRKTIYAYTKLHKHYIAYIFDMPGDLRYKPYTKAKKLQEPVVEKQMLVAQLKNPEGEILGPPLTIPSNITPEQLQILVDQLLNNDEPTPYSFFVENTEIVTTIHEDIINGLKYSTESTINIIYQPQALFKVKPVTRCSSTLSGHTEAILSVCFSPNGSQLATGSGDTTVRIWDLNTETPQFTLRGHTNWVQIVSWSPDCKILASAGMDKTIRLWNAKTGVAIGDALKAHTASITSIAWEPMMANKECNRFASASRDGTVRVWDAIRRTVLFVLTHHTGPVMCLRWGGEGLIYTGSRDKTIKVWDSKDGKLVRSLEGHAHWVNHLALSTDFALRTGSYDHHGKSPVDKEEAQKVAIERYKQHRGNNPEYLVSCSDDFTIFLWDPASSKKPIARLTGHQQPVTHVSFSPDGRWLASASFDKSVKLWDGRTGTFVTTLRGHVGAVYQVTFSPDSRLLLSASKDSTCKVWNLRTKKLAEDLPGHADEVYAVDWSPTGHGGCSGGKDKMATLSNS